MFHIHDDAIIFSFLDKADLQVQLDKSKFLTKRVQFLGHIVREN